MRRYTPAIIAIVSFLIGCAVAPLVVPPLSAQQQNVPRWEYLCFDADSSEDIDPLADRAGASGWELAVVVENSHRNPTWCFKREL
jgi:hypothetical protein